MIIDIVAEVPALPERGGDTLASGVALEVGGGFNLGAFIAGLAAERDAEAAARRGAATSRPPWKPTGSLPSDTMAG